MNHKMLSKSKNRHKSKRIYQLEQIGNARTVQLYADGFESLTKREKIFAYHLSKAAIAGRTIAIDQTGRDAVTIMRLCQEIILHPKGVPRPTLNAIRNYTKLFWINNGMYDYATARKFVPSCTAQEFREALSIAEGNEGNQSANRREMIEMPVKVERTMFDLDYLPVVTDKTPGHDFVAQSANNFYEGLTTAEVESWSRSGGEEYPLNSKVVKKNGLIEEIPWRAGTDRIPAGLYARELSEVISNLERARRVASNKNQKKAIELLIKYFKTGNSEDCEKFNINWVKYSSNVDFILGFIEVYMDPRGQKGKFESVVYFINKEQTHLMRTLASNAKYFEEHAPWDKRYKKTNISPPIANVVNVIVETGDAGPISAIGINLPNEQRIREKHGSKSILIHNIVEAYNESEPERLLEEFCFDQSEIRRAKKYTQVADDLHTGMHEVLGHASGKVSKGLPGNPADYLPGYYSTLEEARADLVALWNVFDRKLKTLRLVKSDEVGRAMYDAYVRNVFLQLRRIPAGEQLEEDHMKNRQMVVNYIMRNSDAIKVVRRRNKTYFHITDYNEMHRVVGDLLAEVMRIKAEGDFHAGKNLVDNYGLKINTSWRDEILKRVKKFKLSAYTGFVMPDLKPVVDGKNKIVDVRIEYPLDLTRQMLEYSDQPNP